MFRRQMRRGSGRKRYVLIARGRHMNIGKLQNPYEAAWQQIWGRPGEEAVPVITFGTSGVEDPGKTGISGAGGISGVPGVSGSEKAGKVPADKDAIKKPGRTSAPEECQTCKERKYQDGSNENVSFKSAQRISPSSAGARVRAHEGEHVANAYNKAKEDGGKVIQASVSIHMGICPECGKTYVAGGTTRTKISYPNENNPYQKERKALQGMGFRGDNIDLAV